MKRSIFAVVSVMALLLAVPAVAQQEEDSRTNPDARSIAPGSGLTITGTVVEVHDEQLVIKSATGVQHIKILPNTQKPVDLQAGVGVSVDYTRTSQGVMIAQTIRTAGVAGEATTDTTASSLTVDTDADLDTDLAVETETDVHAELDTDSDLDADADFNADLDVDTTTADSSFDENLPATGSRLPLLGLLGLLTVAAALGVRSLLR
ncbi:MAG TPA: hypothetical protein VM599_08850 [Thermoanaerobaculia bacterium]|nr:hypothetical protein [Thermoanaerobaculia bacterium]